MTNKSVDIGQRDRKEWPGPMHREYYLGESQLYYFLRGSFYLHFTPLQTHTDGGRDLRLCVWGGAAWKARGRVNIPISSWTGKDTPADKLLLPPLGSHALPITQMQVFEICLSSRSGSSMKADVGT